MPSLRNLRKVPVERRDFFLYNLTYYNMNIRSIFLAALLLTQSSPAQEDELESPWNVSAAARYLSRYTNYGVDLSGDRAALAYNIGLAHEGGFNVSAGAINTVGTGGGLQQWSLGVGYDLQVSEVFTLSAEYTHFSYANDSVNVLATLTNALSFSAEISLGVVDVGFSYDTFLGTNSASYYGLDVSGFHQIGKVSIVPLAQVTFMSQDVENRLLKSNSGPGKGGPPFGSSSSSSSVTTVTGLSGLSLHLVLIYPLVDHLSFTFHPYYQYSPKAEVSTKTSRFVWSIGLRYSFDF